MTGLLGRLGRLKRKQSTLAVTVYSRQNCCCCHKAIDLLRRVRPRLTIEEIDVDTDPALVEQFGQSVPVVSIAGKVRFRGVVNPVLLDRILRAEGK